MDDARFRHPGGTRAADLRRLRAPHLRQRQPADRLPARVSVPHHGPRPTRCRRAPTNCSPSGAAGGSSHYSVGDPAFTPGVPLVSAFRWDTGVQAHAGAGMVSATAAVTAGTLSNPLFSDDNGGRQIAGRVELRPVPGLVLGASAAHGPFVSERRHARPARRAARSSRRQRGAATPSIRATTTWSASKRSQARGACRSRRRLRISARCRRRSMPGPCHRGTLQAAAGFLPRGAVGSPRVQRPDGRAGHGAMGRAGVANRNRRRLFAPAQPDCQGVAPI